MALLVAPVSGQASPAQVVVAGSIITPDERSPAGLFAYLTSGDVVDSVRIGESGTFGLEVERPRCGALALRIDAAPGEERRYHPALVSIVAPARTRARTSSARPDSVPALRVLLVPTRVVVDGGTHGGAVVPIHVDAALSPPWERTRYWRVARAGLPGFGTPVAWADERFPIPVALRGRGGVRSSDSASFWAIARQLESDFGRSLFVPAADDPAEEEILRLIVTVEPRTEADGLTFITYNSLGEIYQAAIALRSAASFRDARLISHELMHALGFGHSSGWYSATNIGLDLSPARATASDVGYAQLLYRLRRAHIAQRATDGILASSVEARLQVSAAASRCGP